MHVFLKDIQFRFTAQSDTEYIKFVSNYIEMAAYIKLFLVDLLFRVLSSSFLPGFVMLDFTAKYAEVKITCYS